jgi:AraC family transcriptional regulator of adaptative response/methylated-DNA-[protein]-cysteine methyltransferase
MFTSTFNPDLTKSGAGDVLIPLIRAAATIGFAIAPCSLGFVIIAVSEHLIRSIMVGEDPEMLMSDLQNQFPNEVLEIMESDDTGLVPKVVDLIEHPDQTENVRAGTTVNYTFLAEQIGVLNADQSGGV